jgi:hypothetical protein
MPNSVLNIRLQGGQKLIERLRTAPSRVVNVLSVKLNALLFQLQSKIVLEKLSGNPLHRKTGTLAGSVRVVPALLQGTSIVGSVTAGCGPAGLYAGVHEYGGSRLYQVLAVKARALAFVTNGKKVIAKSVIHPPAKERSFLRSSLKESAADIKQQLQDALNRELEK